MSHGSPWRGRAAFAAAYSADSRRRKASSPSCSTGVSSPSLAMLSVDAATAAIDSAAAPSDSAVSSSGDASAWPTITSRP